MVRLIIFTGENCPKCPQAKKVVEEVTKLLKMERGKDWDILNIDDEKNLITALQYQIASTPSIVIDEEVFSVGEIPKKEDLIERLKLKSS